MKLKLKEIFYYARAFAVWTLMAAAVGAVCGVVGGAFAIVVEHATHLRQHTSWLPWLMPVAGLAIAGPPRFGVPPVTKKVCHLAHRRGRVTDLRML